jgi:hypothetical protein
MILRGFTGCVGLIPSGPKHEEHRHLIVVHNEDAFSHEGRLEPGC